MPVITTPINSTPTRDEKQKRPEEGALKYQNCGTGEIFLNKSVN